MATPTYIDDYNMYVGCSTPSDRLERTKLINYIWELTYNEAIEKFGKDFSDAPPVIRYLCGKRFDKEINERVVKEVEEYKNSLKMTVRNNDPNRSIAISILAAAYFSKTSSNGASCYSNPEGNLRSAVKLATEIYEELL